MVPIADFPAFPIPPTFPNSDSLDEDKSGLVSMEEFCKLFEPTIVRRASSSTSSTMDVDDVMKETFSGILSDAKVERGIVIQGFMRAHHEICLLYTSPSPRDVEESRMPSSA